MRQRDCPFASFRKVGERFMSVRQPVVIDVPFRADDIQIEQCID